MGTERIVTPEALKTAIAELREKGTAITARTIYSGLGGGSMTTIANLLREFRKQEAAQQAEPAEPVALPPALDEAMRKSAGEMWRAAQHECAVMVSAVKTEAQNHVAEATAERDQHLSELEATTRELEDAKDQIHALVSEKADQGRELVSERMARNTAETRTNELASHVQELQADIKAERMRRDEAETGRREAELALSVCKAESVRLSEQVSGLTQRLADSAGELARTREAAEQATQELRRRHTDELARMEAKHAEVLADLKRRNVEGIDKLQKKNQVLESEASAHVAAAKATAELLGRLQGELDALKRTAAASKKGAGQ